MANSEDSNLGLHCFCQCLSIQKLKIILLDGQVRLSYTVDWTNEGISFIFAVLSLCYDRPGTLSK